MVELSDVVYIVTTAMSEQDHKKNLQMSTMNSNL